MLLAASIETVSGALACAAAAAVPVARSPKNQLRTRVPPQAHTKAHYTNINVSAGVPMCRCSATRSAPPNRTKQSQIISH